MKYFIEITDTGYVDKNKLYTDVKKAVRQYDGTLCHDSSAMSLLRLKIRRDVARLNEKHSRCTPLHIQNEHNNGDGMYCTHVFHMRVLPVLSEEKSKSDYPDPYTTLTGDFAPDAH